MPRVSIKTGFTAPDGTEEVLTEYLCDVPGCPNIGVHHLVLVELRAFSIVCDEHNPRRERRPAA